jgi:hypothetical protein
VEGLVPAALYYPAVMFKRWSQNTMITLAIAGREA